MTAALKLRPYQTEALEAIREAWASGALRPAVVLPTGMGKTVVFAHLIAQEHAAGRRTAVLVHRDELVRQTEEKIRAVAPDIRVGVVKAERSEVDADALVCSVQTLARRPRLEAIPPGSVDLVIVDECHHAIADSYMSALEHFGCWGSTRAVGFTATLGRSDGRGLGAVWEKIAYKRDILFGTRAGYLADVRGRQVLVDGLDLTQVARARGDYQDGALGAALMRVGAGEVIADAYREHASDRQGVVFAPTVAVAEAIAQDMRAAGIVTEVITGATPAEERQAIYKRYREGEVQVLSSCMVLTEGWDAPWASCAVIARPTQSQPLYVQMVGRVLRPWPGKKDALVLDVVGTTSAHRLACIADLSESAVKPRDGESIGEAIARSEEELERGRATGKRETREVDLFRRSASAWLKTPGGTWFIPTREATFFLWPDEKPERWRVGRCGLYTAKDGQWLRGDLPLEYAMAWAEQFAEEADPSVSSRRASWRRRPASQAQKDHARKLRIPTEREDGTPLRKGELSDQISIFYASRMFDRAARRPA